MCLSHIKKYAELYHVASYFPHFPVRNILLRLIRLWILLVYLRGKRTFVWAYKRAFRFILSITDNLHVFCRLYFHVFALFPLCLPRVLRILALADPLGMQSQCCMKFPYMRTVQIIPSAFAVEPKSGEGGGGKREVLSPISLHILSSAPADRLVDTLGIARHPSPPINFMTPRCII